MRTKVTDPKLDPDLISWTNKDDDNYDDEIMIMMMMMMMTWESKCKMLIVTTLPCFVTGISVRKLNFTLFINHSVYIKNITMCLPWSMIRVLANNHNFNLNEIQETTFNNIYIKKWMKRVVGALILRPPSTYYLCSSSTKTRLLNR